MCQNPKFTATSMMRVGSLSTRCSMRRTLPRCGPDSNISNGAVRNGRKRKGSAGSQSGEKALQNNSN
jgi:hypothetical protein